MILMVCSCLSWQHGSLSPKVMTAESERPESSGLSVGSIANNLFRCAKSLTPGLERSSVLTGDTAGNDAFGEIAGAWIQITPNGPELSTSVKSGNRFAIGIHHLTLRVSSGPSLCVNGVDRTFYRVIWRRNKGNKKFFGSKKIWVLARCAIFVVLGYLRLKSCRVYTRFFRQLGEGVTLLYPALSNFFAIVFTPVGDIV